MSVFATNEKEISAAVRSGCECGFVSCLARWDEKKGSRACKVRTDQWYWGSIALSENFLKSKMNYLSATIETHPFIIALTTVTLIDHSHHLCGLILKH